MSQSQIFLIAAAGAIAAATLTYSASPALAGSGNLSCNSPFDKVRTYANSIKCKWAHTYPGRRSAQSRADQLSGRAGCNAHSSPPTVRVWKKNGGWAVRVTFICANIT